MLNRFLFSTAWFWQQVLIFVPLYIICPFPLLLKFFSFSMAFSSLTLMWLGMTLNMFFLLGNFWVSCICMFIILIKFGQRSIISANSFSDLPSSEIPITCMLIHLILSHSSLTLFPQSLVFHLDSFSAMSSNSLVFSLVISNLIHLSHLVNISFKILYFHL